MPEGVIQRYMVYYPVRDVPEGMAPYEYVWSTRPPPSHGMWRVKPEVVVAFDRVAAERWVWITVQNTQCIRQTDA